MGLSVCPVNQFDNAVNNQTQATETDISSESATVRVLVIPTNEELVIARDTERCVKGAEQSGKRDNTSTQKPKPQKA